MDARLLWLNAAGDGCPALCEGNGLDDDDFTASLMCCACGGGSTAVPYVPPAPVSPICEHEVHLDFEDACSRILQNNIGGEGPDRGAEELRIGQVGTRSPNHYPYPYPYSYP